MMLHRRLVLVSLTGGAAAVVAAVAGGCSSFSEPEGADDAGGAETGTLDGFVADSPSTDAATSDADADASHFCDRYADPDASETLCADFDEGQVANYGLGVPSPVAPTVDLGKALSVPGSMRVDDGAGTQASFVTVTSPTPLHMTSSPRRPPLVRSLRR